MDNRLGIARLQTYGGWTDGGARTEHKSPARAGRRTDALRKLETFPKLVEGPIEATVADRVTTQNGMDHHDRRGYRGKLAPQCKRRNGWQCQLVGLNCLLAVAMQNMQDCGLAFGLLH